MTAPAWAPRAATIAALVGFVVVSFAQRWEVLSASPFPLGVDGYFYPVQLRSLLETGSLEYPASPLVFWLLAPFAAATDPITGAKLGAAVLGALVAVPAYAIGNQLGKGRGPGVVAAALATFSAGSFYLTIEFVKNGIGITIALAALWLVLRAFAEPSHARIALAIAGIVAALLAHKMAAGLVLVIAIPATVTTMIGRGKLRGRRLIFRTLLVGVVVVGVLVVGLLAPQRLLSAGDLRLLDELFTWDPDFTAPVLATTRGGLRLGYEPLIALVIGLAALATLVLDRVKWRRERPAVRATAWGAAVLAIAIGWPFLAVDDPQGLGMRLRIVAFVPLALCTAIVLRAALRLPPAAHATICVVLALVFALHVPGSRTEGRVTAQAHMVSAACALRGRIPDGDTAIVPERHIAFMLAWHADVAIAIRPDAVPIDRRWRVMPGAFIDPLRRTGPPDSGLAKALLEIRNHRALPPPLGLHARDPNGLVLVPEVTWQAVLQRLPPTERAYFARWPTI